MNIVRLHADIKCLSLYQCVACNKAAQGETTRLEFDGGSAESLKNFLDAQQLNPYRMPVGWSSNADGFRCTQCTINPDQLPAADWCKNEHPDGLACVNCVSILQAHLDHKAEHGT